MPEVTIDIPANWTDTDLNNFLKYVNTGQDEKATVRSLEYPSCFRDKPCRFWIQEGKRAYQGHCGLGSVTCITAVFNHERPTRWMEKE